MPFKRNFLLGKGEKLTEPIAHTQGFGSKKPPYTFSEAKRNLVSGVVAAVRLIDQLPEAACPNDESVAVITIHPEYLAKSSYPNDLLKTVGLRTVGSRAAFITPKKWTKRGEPESSLAAELFVAGSRQKFRDLAQSIATWTENSSGASDLIKLEDFSATPAAHRIKPIQSDALVPLLEIVLHAGEQLTAQFVLAGFQAYLKLLQIDVDLDKRIDAGELSFLPVRVPREKIIDVAQYSFLRVAREMPHLRQLRPASNPQYVKPSPLPCSLPKGASLDPTIRIAIFDGGLPELPALSSWVNRRDAAGLGEPVEEYQRHGLAVTSAFLFDSFEKGKSAPVPYGMVDHYRVIDKETKKDPQTELYPVLKRIVSVLESEHYDFVNLSIGPNEPVDDDDVHAWTSKLDPLLSTGKVLMTIAVGNSGESDALSRLNRVQPPSDCVNAMAVGSCDSNDDDWARAIYSSVGPSRTPGAMKPDGLARGGTEDEPFWVLSYDDPRFVVPITGTSVASPSTLRAGVGVRAHLGPVLSPLAIRALMVHCCEQNGHDCSEVGWGRFCTDIEKLITCVTGTANVLYQGVLEPRKYLRAAIPVPAYGLAGMVTVKATICITTDTDPQTPMAYTRSGLDIIFRRDKSDIPKGKRTAKTSQFFRPTATTQEVVLRKDSHMWETTQRVSKRMLGQTLVDPVFDIHYNPRAAGRDADTPKPIPYALIVTVAAPRMPDLYDRILSKYRHQLEPMVPKIQIPFVLKP